MIVVILVVLGLCLGSFLCASVWRLHEQTELSQKKKKTDADRAYLKDLSISKGRSMCASCKHELAAKDLVPLLSWALLRGKCRYCREPIGWLEPTVEVVTALLFVLSYALWPQALTGKGLFDFGVWLVLLTGFVALSVYDLKWFLLPDKLVLPLTLLAVVKVAVDGLVFNEGLTLIVSSLTGGLLIAGLFYGLFAISNGRWIGGGDVKLVFMLGLLAGSPPMALLVVFLSSVFGTLAALPLLIRGKANRATQIPYGPFLFFATVVVVLLGDRLIRAYEAIFIAY